MHVKQVLGALLPAHQCLFCLGRTASVVCQACQHSLPHYGLEQQWSRKLLNPDCGRAELAICSLWPYVWPITKVQHLCKFGKWWLGGRMLASFAAGRLAETPFDWQEHMLVPAPMHWRRRILRGANHAQFQGEILARRLGLTVARRALVHRRAIPPQVGLARSQRQDNLRGAFCAGPVVSGARIVLFDDVVTTGATMQSMAEQLYSKGAQQVVGLSLMRVD